MDSIDTPIIKPKSSKSAFGRSTLLMAALAISLPQTSGAQEAQPHEYSTITAERVTAALADGAGKKEISLAEGSLTALGWFVLYGNDDDSRALAEKLNKVVFDAYNGTDRIHGLREQNQYGEMLNLNRFEKRKPESPSPEYTQLTKDRVDKALAEGADTEDFKLAEGSLCALGWLTLYGNDAASLKKGEALMNAASKTWPGSNELYMLITSTAYAEIINLGRFKTRAAPESPIRVMTTPPPSSNPSPTDTTNDTSIRVLITPPPSSGPSTISAPKVASPIKVGAAFSGIWQDEGLYKIDVVGANRTFSGSVTLTQGVNKGYLITFAGQLAADNSIALTRTDQWDGKVIQQTSKAGPPQTIQGKNVWKGTMFDEPTGTSYPFELHMPTNVLTSVQDKAESLIEAGSRNGYQNAFRVSDEIVGVYSNPGMDEVFAAAIQNGWLVELSGLPGKIWSVVPTEGGEGVWLKIGGGHGLTENDVDEGKWQVETQKFSGKWIRGEFHFYTK